MVLLGFGGEARTGLRSGSGGVNGGGEGYSRELDNASVAVKVLTKIEVCVQQAVNKHLMG